MAQMTIFMASYFPCKNLLKNLLTLSAREKLIFEMPIIPQTLNINSSRITKAKSINLHTIRKLIEYSLKSVPIKAMFTPTVFDILISEGRSVFSPVQRGTGSERVKWFADNQIKTNGNKRHLIVSTNELLKFKLGSFQFKKVSVKSSKVVTLIANLGGDCMVLVCRNETFTRPAGTDSTLRLHVEIKYLPGNAGQLST